MRREEEEGRGWQEEEAPHTFKRRLEEVASGDAWVHVRADDKKKR